MTKGINELSVEPKTMTPSPVTSARLRPGFVSLLLAGVTLGVFWSALSNDFINYDDPQYVTENQVVLKGLTFEGIRWALVTGYASNWHPLTWLSHMLDVEMYGVKPWGHHLTNVLFHTVNTVLLFALLRRMTGAQWRSAVVAALFALHPLHVESVAWVAERKDVLSAFFGLLALLFYAQYAQKRSKVESRELRAQTVPALDPRPSTLDYFLSLLFFACGLMSKPMLVTWPFVMLLLDYWPLGRISIGSRNWDLDSRRIAGLIWEKVPFFILSMIACGITYGMQKGGGAVRMLTSFSVPTRLENALISYARYLSKTFWSVDLAVFYPSMDHWPVGVILFAAILLFGLSFLAFWLACKFPFGVVGWFWFLGTLVPVIGLIQVGHQAMADRYTYLPLIGIFVLVTWGVGEMQRRWRLPSIGLVTGLVLTLGACALTTINQLRFWCDSEVLFRHAMTVTKNNALAAHNLGSCLSKQGKLEEAVTLYEEALRFDPNFLEVYNNLGAALVGLGKVDAAVPCFRRLLEAAPDHAKAHDNLGIALAIQGQLNEAIIHFREAIRYEPEHADTHFNLGNVLAMQHRLDEAVREYTVTLRLQPKHVQAHLNLGVALLEVGRREEAIEHLREALKLKPDYAAAKQQLCAMNVQQKELLAPSNSPALMPAR